MSRYTVSKLDDGFVLVTPTGSQVGACLFPDTDRALRAAQWLEMGYAAGDRNARKECAAQAIEASKPANQPVILELKPAKKRRKN